MNDRATQFGKEQREKILQAIIEYTQEHGYSPTVREIGAMTGLSSTSSLHHHLSVMFENGMIESDCAAGTPRAIRVPGYKFVKIGADEA